MPELRLMFDDIPAAPELAADQQRRFLFNAYLGLLHRVARNTPVAIVLEDLHWADEPTLMLLQHIVSVIDTTPVFMMGTYRDVELDAQRPFARSSKPSSVSAWRNACRSDACLCRVSNRCWLR